MSQHESREKASQNGAGVSRSSPLLFVLGFFALIGAVSGSAQILDYASSKGDLLIGGIGVILIFGPLLLSAGYAYVKKDYLGTVLTFATVVPIAIGLALVLVANPVPNPEAPSGATRGTTSSPPASAGGGLQRCQALVEVKTEPKRRRNCESLKLSTSLADLDNLEPSWGNPDTIAENGADLESERIYFRQVGAARLSLLNENQTYAGCTAQSVYAGAFPHFDLKEDAVFCARTSEGRRVMLFVDKLFDKYPGTNESGVEMYVIVWDKPS